MRRWTKAVIRRIEGGLEAISALCLLGLMLIVLVDVVGRDLANRPLSWASEVLEIVVAAMVFLQYPVVGFRARHITVDLVHLGPSVQRLQRMLGAAFGAAAFGIIAWSVGKQALRSLDYGEASPILGISLGGVLAAMSALAVLTVAGFLLAMVRRATVTTDPSPAETVKGSSE